MTRLGVVFITLLLGACAGSPTEPVASAGKEEYRAPPAAQSRFVEALALMDDQAWAEAATAMTSIYSDYPFLSGPALNAALIYSQQGDDALADEWYQRALLANPASVDAHSQYAVFLRTQGSYDLAEQHYLAALETDPDSAVTHYNLGILYDLYLGRKAEALGHFARYQALNPETDRRVAGWVADLERQVKAGERS